MTPISIRALTKAFGSTTAVDHIDLSIPAGSLFFLLGPSGCGKTTLLRMIAGFTQPTSGTILLGDRDVTFLPPNQRNTGMVFQSYALWPHMTVAQNVAFGLDVRKIESAEKQKRVEQALDRVQMLKYAARKPNELSGGQQQRVALARALVIEPAVLLLDEPLSNLDAKLRLEMRTRIHDICKAAKITGVYVTHDQKEALSMADGIAVLRGGKIIQTGSPQNLYARPGNQFVADFLGETNFVPATVTHLIGGVAGGAEKIARLSSAAGELFSSALPEGLNVGEKVTCSIRPEAIGLVFPANSRDFANASASENGKENRVDARHVSRIYLGETAQHLFGVGDNLQLKVFELHPRQSLDATSNVVLKIDSSDVVVLRD